MRGAEIADHELHSSVEVAPERLEAGAWEGQGVSPDVSVPTRWDLFTEAPDPALRGPWTSGSSRHPAP